jgi:hypothetical protein
VNRWSPLHPLPLGALAAALVGLAAPGAAGAQAEPCAALRRDASNLNREAGDWQVRQAELEARRTNAQADLGAQRPGTPESDRMIRRLTRELQGLEGDIRQTGQEAAAARQRAALKQAELDACERAAYARNAEPEDLLGVGAPGPGASPDPGGPARHGDDALGPTVGASPSGAGPLGPTGGTSPSNQLTDDYDAAIDNMMSSGRASPSPGVAPPGPGGDVQGPASPSPGAAPQPRGHSHGPGGEAAPPPRPAPANPGCAGPQN